ncbi:MAG: hypothetical protein AAGI53_06130 [Planctomycetota bacterium]
MAHIDLIVPIQPGDSGVDAFVAALEAHEDTVPLSLTLVAPPGVDVPQASERVRGVVCERTAADEAGLEATLTAAGLDASVGTHALVLRTSDRLVPGALGVLVRAASRNGPAGAIGAWVACDDRGRPVGPEADAPGEAARVGLEVLLDGYTPASCAVLIDRSSLDTRRPAPTLGEASALDLLLRVVEQGDRFAAVPNLVAMRRAAYGGVQSRWASLTESMTSVIRRSFSRAATLGFEAAGVDLSEAREQAAVLALTIRVATRAALADSDPRCAAATELLRPVATRDSITPELAAWAAADALRRGDGFTPAIDGVSERLWSRPVRGWWSRFVGERWAERHLVDVGAGLLAQQLVSRAAIAKATMADLAGLWSPGERFYVAGDGAAARAMAAHAAKAGCFVEVLTEPGARLQASDVVHANQLDKGTIEIIDADAQIGVDAPLVVIDTESPSWLARFAGRPNLVRWSASRGRLEQRATSRLASAWAQRESALV